MYIGQVFFYTEKKKRNKMTTKKLPLPDSV